MYGLMYTRATPGRCTQNAIAKDDDLIIGSLPKEKMKKVSAGSSSGKRRHRKENLKEDSKAEYSKKESWSGKVLLAGNGKVELNTLLKEDGKNINTPTKQKKDGEIVRSYLLSVEKIGKRMKIYWSGSRRWFTGRIEAFDKKNRLDSILYEDGDKEVLDLRKERFELEVLPTDPFKLKSDSHSARKADGLDVEDTGNVGEALMEENSKNVNGAKTMVKSSKSKQKKETMKEAERTEAVKEAAEELEAEATARMGSDNSSIKGSVQAMDDDSLSFRRKGREESERNSPNARRYQVVLNLRETGLDTNWGRQKVRSHPFRRKGREESERNSPNARRYQVVLNLRETGLDTNWGSITANAPFVILSTARLWNSIVLSKEFQINLYTMLMLHDIV
ncbi:hypothetical protein COLO4_06117 [Corchorus olitorius]|uniref:Tudor domain-containing protein n=1 Tax=Corchorus olitorius TaxID=93759 RepID=A0A1R3KNZ9_9ROSI|nr:hypothetical protein COLO4_06117 [Corchorus olitorius]